MDLETYDFSSHLIREHFVNVPLDHQSPNSKQIRVFVREIVKPKNDSKEDLKDLVFLQGGPGGSCSITSVGSFVKEFCDKDYRVYLLDQRGTGLSTPISVNVMSTWSPEEQVAYLQHFRADSIVRDCEIVRKTLIGKDKKWTTLGQSYGGFLTFTYISVFPDSIEEAFITGGMAPIKEIQPDRIYEDCFKRVIKRNETYYKKYPADIDRVARIVQYLQQAEVKLPNSSRLSAQLFMTLGLAFGGHGGLDSVHQIVLRADTDLEDFGKLSYGTLSSIDDQIDYERRPIYALLHEAIYCSGRASKWSASRIAAKQHSHFLLDNNSPSRPIYFTGEMIFEFMFDDLAMLRPFKQAAHILAEKADWSDLYNLDVLRKTDVKVSAITYLEDIYVSYDLALETAAVLRDCKLHVTNEWQHNALSRHSKQVAEKLLALSDRYED